MITCACKLAVRISRYLRLVQLQRRGWHPGTESRKQMHGFSVLEGSGVVLI